MIRPRMGTRWLALSLVAFALLGALVGAATASHRTASVARKIIDLTGSYQYISHINGGPSSSGTMSIGQSGRQITGGIVLGNSGFSVKGKITGVTNGVVDLAFKAFGAKGYVVNETGTATCNGSEMSGGWVDSGGENGSWNATRQAGKRGDAAAAGCCIPPSLAATAHATRDGQAVDIEVIARTPHCGGTAHISLRDARGDVPFTKLTRSGNKQVGTAHLSGRRSCIQTLTASVHQGGTTFEQDAQVQGGAPVLTGHATRDNVGEATLTLDANNARPASVCGKPTMDATPVGTAHRVIPLTVKRLKQRSFVGTARLPANQSCFTSASFLSRQVDIQDTLPGIIVSGSPATVCML